LKDNEICFRVIGNLSLIPEDICKLKAEVIIITRENNRMFVNYAIAYTCKYNYNKLYLCLHLILYNTKPAFRKWAISAIASSCFMSHKQLK